MLRAGLLGYRRLNRAKGIPYRCLSGQMELHAANIGLVGDGQRVQLEHYGESDGLRSRNGFLSVGRQSGFDYGNAVGGENLLGFELGEDRSIPSASGFNDRIGRLWILRIRGGQSRGFVKP